ncbi:hypothetical protein BDV25DRAFT_18267 [Aspergillus avenaceus]|uniref:Uncharacterized protein n=1 Tax=Aspergillus avenaceus TaxID=36643 RepID=A0A5N6U590_ASPAV|nr:hypothetical protein BDV25DRAFT_18267 [Aspergillus avenaceus]
MKFFAILPMFVLAHFALGEGEDVLKNLEPENCREGECNKPPGCQDCTTYVEVIQTVRPAVTVSMTNTHIECPTTIAQSTIGCKPTGSS